MDNKSLILSFIKKHHLAVLSTVAPDGTPEAAVIEFGETDNLELIFDTFKTFRKYTNLKQNPKVALVIGWDENITLQYEGVAEELEGEALEKYKKLYFKKIPEAEKWALREGIAYFKVSPKWIRYTNLNKDPWEIKEINF